MIGGHTLLFINQVILRNLLKALKTTENLLKSSPVQTRIQFFPNGTSLF